MYTFLIIVFHVYLGLLWRVHTREHGSGMLSLVLEFIKVSLFPGGCIPERRDKTGSNGMCFVSRFTNQSSWIESISSCFKTKLEECIPERRDKWKVIECVLSLVLQPNPHGYIEITLFPGKLEECISERNYSSVWLQSDKKVIHANEGVFCLLYISSRVIQWIHSYIKTSWSLKFTATFHSTGR